MNKILRNELSAGLRGCRVCGASFIGHGALCAVHAAELATKIAEENKASAAITAAREVQRNAERQARRMEWAEAV